MTELFIILSVVVFAAALRSFDYLISRKLGAVGILGASFLAFYFPTGSAWAGVCGLMVWFVFPWVELLTRTRTRRLPMSHAWHKQAPPGSTRLPELAELTEEIEEEGFEYVADAGWEGNGTRQFYRLFHNEEEKSEASISLTERDGYAWLSLSLTSRLEDGRTFRTTDMPYSSPMKPLPEVNTKQLPGLDSFDELLGCHRAWIYEIGVWDAATAERTPEKLMDLMEDEAGREIRHNLNVGLVLKEDSEASVRYSWRGLFYLYFQQVKDMVRMC